MVTEHALITITPGSEEAFEAAFPAAHAVITAAPGCLNVRLERGVERSSTYQLLVEWETLEAHVDGFRASPAFAEWRAIIGPYFAEPPVVEHYTAVALPE